MSARITIEGNLTADPDFGVSNSGVSWARLRVAISQGESSHASTTPVRPGDP